MPGQEDIEVTCEVIQEILEQVDNDPPLLYSSFHLFSTSIWIASENFPEIRRCGIRKCVVASNISLTLVSVNWKCTILVLVWMPYKFIPSVKPTLTSGQVEPVVYRTGTMFPSLHGTSVQRWNAHHHITGNSANQFGQRRPPSQIFECSGSFAISFYGSASTGKHVEFRMFQLWTLGAQENMHGSFDTTRPEDGRVPIGSCTV